MSLLLPRRTGGPALAAFLMAYSLGAPAGSAPVEPGGPVDEAGLPIPPGQPAPLPPPTGPVTVNPVAAEVILRARADAFSRFRGPLPGKADAVGSYSNGCLVGGVALPRSGAGFEVIRLGRNRRFGHPDLVAYVRRLASAAKKQRLGTLVVGDLAQPRGGPTPSGHRSHQSGLDVDIGFTRPAWLGTRPMTAFEREQASLMPVLDLSTRTLTADWGPKVERLIGLAASDPDVERVFVNPRIKRELCDRAARRAIVTGKVNKKAAREDWSWLRVVRPWWGHHDHMHVRLKCPGGSSGCEPQNPLPPGDGCSEIAWWETEEVRRAREPRRDPPVPVEPRPPPPLPAACQTIFEKVPDERGGGLRTTAQRQGR